MKLIDKDNLVNHILSSINEVDIFSYYTNIGSNDIEHSLIHKSYKVNNPFRVDENASVSFRFKSGKTSVRFVDWADDRYNGDCFYIAGIALGLNSNNPSDFTKILKHIIAHVGDGESHHVIQTEVKVGAISKIDILAQSLTDTDVNYYKQFGIRNTSLENTVSVDRYWIDDYINRYIYSRSDICIGYILDAELSLIKLYFPFRNKKDKRTRFITNNPHPIERLQDIKPNDNLIITKARKDTLLLKQMIRDLGITDTEVTNLSGENVKLNKEYITTLRSMFKCLAIWLDNDSAGIQSTKHYLENGFIDLSSKDTKKDPTDISKSMPYRSFAEYFITRYKLMINAD